MKQDFQRLFNKIPLDRHSLDRILANKILLQRILIILGLVVVAVLLGVMLISKDSNKSPNSHTNHTDNATQHSEQHEQRDVSANQSSQQQNEQTPYNQSQTFQNSAFSVSKPVPQALQNPQRTQMAQNPQQSTQIPPNNAQSPASIDDNASPQSNTHIVDAKYNELIVTPSQAQGLGIKDIPIQNPSITRGVPFNALIDFDDRESITQSSTFDVVVAAIYMREGEAINAGDEICEINSNELNNSYFELENTRNRYRVAQEVAQKDKGLYESGVISQREYQTSYLASRELFLKLSQLENSFKLFGIDPKRPKGKSGFRVIASSSGILSVAPKTTGEKIPAFTPYVRISKSNDLLARIKIPASISDYVVPGSKVYSEQGQYVGDISSVSVVLDKTNNSITAIANLQKGIFRVGEVADIYIEGKQPKGTFALPSDAIIKNGKDNLIFIKTQNGYMPKVVSIVEKRSKSFVIDSSGLKGNEQVASGALIALKGLINNVGEGGHSH